MIDRAGSGWLHFRSSLQFLARDKRELDGTAFGRSTIVVDIQNYRETDPGAMHYEAKTV